MRSIAGVCVAISLWFGAGLQGWAGEDPHSENMRWLQQVKPVMTFFIDFMEPLERANSATTLYLIGDMGEDTVIYELEESRYTLSMIAENLQWSIEMLPPAPDKGGPGSQALVDKLSNLSARARDIDTASEQAMSLFESYVQDGSYLSFEGGVKQTLVIFDTIADMVGPYYDIALIAIPEDEDLRRNLFITAKCDDILLLETIQLFYASLLTPGEPRPEAEIVAFVEVLDVFTEAVETQRLALLEVQEESDQLALGETEYMAHRLAQAVAENKRMQKRASAYHKIIAFYSTDMSSSDLFDAGMNELNESFPAQMPSYRQASSKVASEKEKAAEEQAAYSTDTPL